MADYEIVNEETGEIESFKTSINIQQLEDYNQWKVEQMLNPPTYSPQEYAKHIESEQAKDLLRKIRIYIEDNANEGVLSGLEMLEIVAEMLNEE